MAHFYVVPTSAVGVDGTGRAQWAPATHYHVGDRVVCRTTYGVTARRIFVYECTSASGNQLSHATTEPTWNNVVGATVTDNPGADQVVWTCRVPTSRANASIFLYYLIGSNAGVSGAPQTGDTVWVNNTLTETWTGDLNIFNNAQYSLLTNPVKIISTSDTTNDPPTSAASGFVLRTSGSIIWYVQALYVYGVEFQAGYSAASGTPGFQGQGIDLLPGLIVLENCKLKLAYAVTGCYILLGPSVTGYTPHVYMWRDVDVEFTHAGQQIKFQLAALEWHGGALLGTAPTVPFLVQSGASRQGINKVVGVDLSLCTGNLVTQTDSESGGVRFSRCKLNAGATPFTGTPSRYTVLPNTFEICDSGTKNYKLHLEQYSGKVDEEIVYVRTDGATDGVTPVSWEMVTNANAKPYSALRTPWVALWNDDTGSAVTITMEVLHDSVTALTDKEVWIEVFALTTSGFPLASFVHDGIISSIAGTAQPSSSVTWYTTGMTNPNKQKVSVQVTPQLAGLLYARVCLAKANYTMYADPFITIS